MRKDWEYKKLGEVANVVMGQSPDGSNVNNENGMEFHQGKINFGEQFLMKSDCFTTQVTKVAEKGSILLCVRAPIGIINITDRDICIGRGLCAIKEKTEVDNLFLYYYLLNKKLYFEKNSTGSTFKAISSKVVLNTPIFLPPKPTQLAIVAELDKLNEMIRLKKQQLEDYDQLAQSIFYEMFGDPVENEKGWEVKKLGDICPPKPTQLAIVAELDKLNEMIRLKKQQLEDYDQLAQSIFYEMFGDPVENEKGWEVKKLGDICEVTSAKRVFIEEVVDSGVPFIRGTELTALNRLTRGEKMEYSLFITKEHYERLKAITGVPKYGDLLIPSINSEGIAWIVNTEEPLYFKDGRVLWVHVNQDVFKSECLQKIMNILLKHTYKSMGGATFSELKLFVLRELKVPIPPIESQQQFAARIEAMERQKQQVSETIKDLETLLASRMQYWFD